MGCGAVSKGYEFDTVKFETIGGTPEQCIIMLHGFGRTGPEIKGPCSNLLTFSTKTKVRMIFPTAPVVDLDKSKAAVTLRTEYAKKRDEAVGVDGQVAGAVGRAGETAYVTASSLFQRSDSSVHGSTNSWCEDAAFENLDEMMLGDTEHLKQSIESGSICKAVAHVHQLIREQIKAKIKPEKITVAGHGTGGFIAARAALSFPDASLGQLWILSGWIGGGEPKVDPKQAKIKVLNTHGDKDPIVSKEVFDTSTKRLKEVLPNAEIRSEEIEGQRHFIWDEMKDDKSKFAKLVLEYI